MAVPVYTLYKYSVIKIIDVLAGGSVARKLLKMSSGSLKHLKENN